MNIIKLQAENVLRMEAFTIEPTDNTVVITGKNGQGKSSVLNTILMGLAGKDAMRDIPKPVKDGADEGRIKINLGGKYTIDVYMTKEGTRYLHVYGMDGKEFKSPQTLLDNMLGDLTIDPSEIITMKPKELKELLLKIINLDINLEEWAKKREDLYTERTATGREHKSLEAQLEALPVPNADIPAEEISITGITKRYQDAVDNNNQIEKLSRDQRICVSGIDEAKAEIERLQAKIKNLQENIDAIDNELKTMAEVDLTPIMMEMDASEGTNIKVREKQNYFKFSERVDLMGNRYSELSRLIDNLDKEKYDALAKAAMPIDGLGIDMDEVTYNGIPYAQCSDAEKIKVAMAIAMAKNPEIKVILMRQGTLLDEDNLELIKEIAQKHEYQMWLEIVSNNDKIGIYIEDGKVKKNNYEKSS